MGACIMHIANVIQWFWGLHLKEFWGMQGSKGDLKYINTQKYHKQLVQNTYLGINANV